MSDSGAEWETADFGSLFRLNTPGFWGEDASNGPNVLVLRSTNFKKTGGLIYETAAPRLFDQKKLVQKRLLPGDIILERSGGSPAQPVGRVNRFDADGVYSVSNFMQILRPHKHVDSHFAYYLLDDFYRRGGTETLQKATTGIRNLDFQAYLKTPICLPLLDEQRRIADVLRAVDEAIAQNATVIATCERTVEMLATTIAEPTGDTLCVEDFGRIVTGRTPAPSQTELWGGSLPFITPGDLSDGVITVDGAARHLQADTAHGGKVLPAGSVLVTCIGSTVGKTAIVRTPCATNQQINAVCCEKEISGYVYLACVALYDEITANAGRQAVPIINKSTFARLPVASRERSEMVEISSVVDALDAQMQQARSALGALNRVKEQVADELLSGRVRVPA